MEEVINEVSLAQVLKLKTHLWQVHEAKYLPPQKVTYSHTEVHHEQAIYLTLRYISCFFSLF